MVRQLYEKELTPLTRQLQHQNLVEILERAHLIAESDDILSDSCFLCTYPNTQCRCLASTTVFRPQSGETTDVSITKMNCITKEQNVSFSDKQECYGYNVASVTDPTRSAQDTGDVMLGDFFKRPVKIFETQWEVSSTLYQTFNPWSLFCQDTRVANRLNFYNMFRGNLHVKFVVNGNSFHYGRILTSYLPLHNRDDITQHRSNVIAELTQESQQPHVFLNPTQSTGGEMVLPFFWHRNYASLPDGDYAQLGLMTLRSFATLKHANGADDRVTISCFAWFDEIELTQLTSQDMLDLAPQSGEIDEANSNGTISTPATAVAKMAGRLAAIPEIAPFALATQSAATAVAGVARAFGYSRPSQTRDPAPFKPLALSDLAPTTTPDGSRKLTVDDKQELTIDPRISGINSADPMAIKEIAKRESFTTQFTWAQSAVPEDFLFNMRVDPCMFSQNVGISTEYFLTASAAASVPFKYWTGSMRIRLQFVCSAYHRGRVKIVYDPNWIDNSPGTYNTNFVHIVDLAEKQDFTIEIGPGQNTTLMEHNKPGIASSSDLYSGFTEFNTSGPGNGVIGVYCVNELTTPNSLVNNDIQVNVFVSMGDDFEVFVPDDHFQSLVWDRLFPQSGEIFLPQSGEVADPTEHTVQEEDKPQQTESDTLGASTIQTKDLNLVFTGESIFTFRQMIKRFNLHSSLGYLASSPSRFVMYGRRNAYPYLRGYVAGAVDEDSNGFNYNYCNTVMIHWVTMMFQGWRGSVRWKIVPRGTLTEARPMLQVQRYTDDANVSLYRQGVALDPTNQSNNEARYRTVYDTTTEPGFPVAGKTFPSSNGAVIFSGYLNPLAEFEVPYYSRERFTPGKRENYMIDDQWHSDAWDYQITCPPNQEVSYESFCAAGEDFQVYFFTGLPGLFYEPTAPIY